MGTYLDWYATSLDEWLDALASGFEDAFDVFQARYDRDLDDLDPAELEALNRIHRGHPYERANARRRREVDGILFEYVESRGVDGPFPDGSPFPLRQPAARSRDPRPWLYEVLPTSGVGPA